MREIPQKDETTIFNHKHGGNGFAIIEDISDDYCRVVGVGVSELNKRAFVAWKKLLSPFGTLTPALLDLVNELRRDLRDGHKKVVRSWIVPKSNMKLTSASHQIFQGEREIITKRGTNASPLIR